MSTRYSKKVTALPANEKLILVLAFTMVISVMNGTMYNVALPTISQEFSLANSQVGWMITAYIIVYAIGSVIYGKLADKYQLKNLLTFGLCFFALGSLIGLIAAQYWMVIVGRVLQAVGSSVIPAASMIIPIRYFPPETRGRAIGIVTAGMAFGAAIGPVISGVLTSMLHWRALFALSILILVTLPLLRKYLQDEVGVSAKTDLPGGILLGGAVASLLLAVTYGSWAWGVGGLILMSLFLARIVYAAEPFIRLELFKNRKYTIGLVISFFIMSSGFIIFFTIPFLLSDVNQLSPFLIGLTMFPGALCAALISKAGGKLADQKGNIYLVTLAGGLLMISFLLLSGIAGISPWIMPLLLIIFNVGLNFMHIAIANTISSTLPKDQAGVGMGLMMMLNFIAGAIVTVFIGKVLDLDTISLQLNPFVRNEDALIYSNIYFVVAVVILLMLGLYHLQYGSLFRKKSTKTKPQKGAKLTL